MAKHLFRANVAKMGNADVIQRALGDWAARTYGTGATAQNLRRLTGGASQETWSFDVRTGKELAELILRRASAGRDAIQTSDGISLATESVLLELAGQNGVPVPGVLHVFGAESDIGEAFVMNRIEGETIARKILRDEEYASMLPSLAAECGRALAGIHAISLQKVSDVPQSDGVNQIEKYEANYRELNTPRPVFDLAIAWLKSNAPSAASAVLVHGDFRLGNFIVRPDGLAAVLDWELAHIGDPREDIAWICVNAWRFGQSAHRVGGFGELEDLLKAYESAGGAAFSESEIDWWEIMGSLKWGIMCMFMYETFRSGAEASVERAAIGRRVSENEIDLINLLERQARHA